MRTRNAFSLAELMIALIILGFGLLIIGAALPVGLDHSKRTAELANGEAAAQHGLDSVTAHIRLASAGGITVPGQVTIKDNVFRPRSGVFPFAVNSAYEPLIKVRPLAYRNVPFLNPAGGVAVGVTYTIPVAGGQEFDWQRAVEHSVSDWFTLIGAAPPDPQLEFDENTTRSGNPPITLLQAVGPSTATVFPPMSAPWPQRPWTFFGGTYAAPATYAPDQTTTVEADAVHNRRVFWLSFYRRLAYDKAGPDGVIPSADDINSDPDTYEVISVACRVPGANSRFMATRLVSSSVANPDLSESLGLDGVLPMPVLVTFDAPLPAYTGPIVMPPNGPDGFANSGDEVPSPGQDLPNLRFVCSFAVGSMLPAGSIFIPAVNDAHPQLVPGRARLAGLFPYSPDVMPIFEVLERTQNANGSYTLTVKNNGLYPWVNPASGLPPAQQAAHWPVWVIPPAFQSRGGRSGDPVFDGQSPVISTARRVIRLREVTSP